MTVPVITIDGPGGVGKGTVARWLAKHLGWHWLDSGALYRLAAIASRTAGVPPDDAEGIAALCRSLDVGFDEEGDTGRVWLAGADVSDQLRLESTGALASILSAYPAVRSALLERQRAYRRSPGLVADGRDMGTVVFPDAPLKLFLDAKAEERARRRWLQLREAGVNARLDDLHADVDTRDARDRDRSASPLRPASDAVVMDTTQMSVDVVEHKIAALVAERGLDK